MCKKEITNKIIWYANWIWYPVDEDVYNLYLYIRKAIDIQSSVSKARIFCTANDIYQLYINGRMVGRGPSPSGPGIRYFDVYELIDYFKPGKNVISVLCYTYGEEERPTLLNHHAGPGGLLFQAEIYYEDGGKEIIVSDGTWKVTQAQAWLQDAPLISGHRGEYKEFYDSTKEIRGWMGVDFDDSSWKYGVCLGKPPCKPWTNLVPREIPFLKREEIFPVNVYVISVDKTYGFGENINPEIENPGHLVEGYDTEATTKILNATEGREVIPFSHDTGYTIVKVLNPDFSPSVMLDFGKEVVGFLRIKIAESRDGVIDIAYGESLNLTYVDRLILSGGRQEFSPFHRRAFRYVQLTFSDCPQPIKIESVNLELTTYPVEYKGTFECSDELLNRIWDVGRYTLQLCMQEHYEDCPWREQTLYLADLRVEALVAYYTFGDVKLAAKCLRQMAWVQDSDGSIPAAGPFPAFERILPDFCAYWVMALWDYYLYSGDEGLVRELYPNLCRLMGWFEKKLNEYSLIGHADRQNWWCFIDWVEMEKKCMVTALECLYYKALLDAGRLSLVVNDETTSNRLNHLSRRVKESINKYLWSDESRCYVDCWDGVKVSTHITWQTNVLSVLFGVAEKEKWPRIYAAISDKKKVASIKTAFMNFYVAQTLFKMELQDDAIRLIRNYWGEMLKRGATTFWEVFDPDPPPGLIPDKIWSLCHGFSAGPTYLLPAEVLGVKPLEPGFKKFSVAPNIANLDWAKGKVPTPYGDIDVYWNKDKINHCFKIWVTAPSGCEAEVTIPKMDLHEPRIFLNDKLIQEAIRTDSLSRRIAKVIL